QAYQALGHDAVKRRDQAVRFDVHVEEAADHIKHVVGVQRGKDQMSCERRPRAKVSPFFSLTGICSTPGNWYSTGSSMVMILSRPVCVSEMAAYSVVVLPL